MSLVSLKRNLGQGQESRFYQVLPNQYALTNFNKFFLYSRRGVAVAIDEEDVSELFRI